MLLASKYRCGADFMMYFIKNKMEIIVNFKEKHKQNAKNDEIPKNTSIKFNQILLTFL
jgi:hypothetical protein